MERAVSIPPDKGVVSSSIPPQKSVKAIKKYLKGGAEDRIHPKESERAIDPIKSYYLPFP
jgi:hypothetical protein